MPHALKPAKHRSRRSRLAGLVLAACLALPAAARADDEAIPDHDARLDGYSTNVVLDAGGTASTYILLFLLGGVGLGVVFISSKRSHLD